jgi:hypothetical protein
MRWALALSAVALMSAIAGLRDFDVAGPDVQVYGNFVFKSATQASSFVELQELAATVSITRDPAYLALNFLVSRFTSDPHLFYFWLSFLVSSLALAAAMLLRRHGPVWLMWLTYLCTVYVTSFNLLRQSPAFAMVLLAVAMTVRGRPWWGLVVGLSGLLFHDSAIVFLAIWPIILFLQRGKWRLLGRSALVLLLVAGLVLAGPVLIEWSATFLADGRYLSYLEGRGGEPLGLNVLYRAVPLAVGLALMFSFGPRFIPPAPKWVPQWLPKRMVDGLAILSGSGVAERRPDDLASDSDRRTSGLRLRTELGLTQWTVHGVLITLLAVGLLILPLRELFYPIYRVALYFGDLRILAYGVIIGSLPARWRPTLTTAAVLFVVAYFILVVVLRGDGLYSSDILERSFGL